MTEPQNLYPQYSELTLEQLEKAMHDYFFNDINEPAKISSYSKTKYCIRSKSMLMLVDKEAWNKTQINSLKKVI